MLTDLPCYTVPVFQRTVFVCRGAVWVFEPSPSRIPGRASARSRPTRSRPLASRTRSQIGARARRAWATRGGSSSSGSATLERVSSSQPRPVRRDGGDTAGGGTGTGTTPRDLAPWDLPRGALRTRLAVRAPLRHHSRPRHRARSLDLGPREKTVRAFGPPGPSDLALVRSARPSVSLPDHTSRLND